MKILVIGVGNGERGDDKLGSLAVERLKKHEHEFTNVEVIGHGGEPASLLDRWQGYDYIILIDAVMSKNGVAGEVFNFDLIETQLPEEFRRTSTHGFGIFEAIELGKVLNQMPKKASFHGIEGKNFNVGEDVSAEMMANIDKLVENVIEELNNA